MASEIWAHYIFFVVCGDAVPMELISKVHKFNLLSSLMAKRSTSPINQIYVQRFSVRKKSNVSYRGTTDCKMQNKFRISHRLVTITSWSDEVLSCAVVIAGVFLFLLLISMMPGAAGLLLKQHKTRASPNAGILNAYTTGLTKEFEYVKTTIER